jgi:IS605 OrfB family transposase
MASKNTSGNDSISFTAHTVLRNLPHQGSGKSLFDILDDMGFLYGRIKRTLFKDSVRFGKNTASFKNDYLKKYGITARQFNAIRYDLDGDMRSATEALRLRIAEIQDRIKSSKRRIKSKESKTASLAKNIALPASNRNNQINEIHFKLHHMKRRLHTLEQKLDSLADDLKNGRVRICFGSKGLFRKQFALNENGYIQHEEWADDWKRARSNSFFCLGSKDETAGNQTCTLASDGTLRIRVPECMAGAYGRHISIPGVRYPYGQEIIDRALVSGTAVTHCLVRAVKGWYLHTTVDVRKAESVTYGPRETGCIGVDVNEKEIAVSETDRYGNLVWSATHPACVKDRTSSQTEAVYGDICKEIVDRAISTGKPIAHETLDFAKKKSSLREEGVKYSRMLSGFAYSAFLAMLDRRAFKYGVSVYPVNPAFTTVIGKVNHMSRYGMSPHEAAALVIARRAQRYAERPSPSSTAFPLPARNRGKHVWSLWRTVKASGACDNINMLYRRSLQDPSCSAEPQAGIVSLTTAESPRPPVHRPRKKKAPREIPVTE